MNIDKHDRCLCGRLYLKTDADGHEWIHEIVDALPNDFRLKYFGYPPEPVKAPKAIDSSAFRESLVRGERPFLYGQGYHLSCMQFEATSGEVRIFSDCVPIGRALMETWFPRLESCRLIYGWAALLPEEDQRNGYWVGRPSADRPKGHGWLGRDYRRYVPGLYWLNYFSHEYTRQRDIDVDWVASRTGGRLTPLTNGSLLDLYGDPEKWREKNELIADVLDSIPGFFSKRLAGIPESVPEPTRLEDVMRELGKKWP